MKKEIMKNKERLTNEAFEISGHIRYIAVYDNDGLSMKQCNDINNVSSNESDKYEEPLPWLVSHEPIL
ncbi:MAG TPA: hypothetical protein VET23_02210 [Chitinophagaceae bacterium]|nr:hypothetical protein [Chitinophagaceae bacterium]